MTDVQLYLALGIPFLAITVSMIINMLALSGLREEMRTGFKEMREDIREIRQDMKLMTGNFTS